MKIQNTLPLLDLLQEIDQKQRVLEELGLEMHFLDNLMDTLEEIILDEMAIPKDNTLDYVLEDGGVDWEAKDLFCRDIFYEVLYDDEQNSKDKFEKLQELKKEYDESLQ